jgi:hypothetical protein
MRLYSLNSSNTDRVPCCTALNINGIKAGHIYLLVDRLKSVSYPEKCSGLILDNLMEISEYTGSLNLLLR